MYIYYLFVFYSTVFCFYCEFCFRILALSSHSVVVDKRDGGFCPKNTVFKPIFHGFFYNGKGGYPPPLHGRSVSENGNFFAENGVFCPKNTVFGPIFNGFFLNGKGGYPPPPLHGRSVPENLTEKS